LLTIGNVIISSPIGSASFNTRRDTVIIAAEKLLAGLHGELPEGCVNPETLRTWLSL